tara:strand:+ start:22391 stop:22642 length:252 start_codon:yes stop_codon:yes gene_type:complete
MRFNECLKSTITTPLQEYTFLLFYGWFFLLFMRYVPLMIIVLLLAYFSLSLSKTEQSKPISWISFARFSKGVGNTSTKRPSLY